MGTETVRATRPGHYAVGGGQIWSGTFSSGPARQCSHSQGGPQGTCLPERSRGATPGRASGAGRPGDPETSVEWHLLESHEADESWSRMEPETLSDLDTDVTYIVSLDIYIYIYIYSSTCTYVLVFSSFFHLKGILPFYRGEVWYGLHRLAV